MLNALCVDADDLSGAFLEGGWRVRNPVVHAARETEALLAALDELSLRATFFVPGHFLDGGRPLVSRMAEAGHEVASHGTRHCFVESLGVDGFREDLRRSKGELEALAGRPVETYKAPIWSITPSCLWAYPVLAEEGFRVDHSAMPEVVRALGRPVGSLEPFRPDGGPWVVPATAARLLGRQVPLPGGFYNAWAPTSWLCRFYAGLNRQGLPFNLYFHPFEHSPAPENRRIVKRGSAYISLYGLHAGRYARILPRVAGAFELGTLQRAYARWIGP